jgi:hypothetical protein
MDKDKVFDKQKLFNKTASVLKRINFNKNERLEMEESIKKLSFPTHLTLACFYNLKIKYKNIQIIFVTLICLFIVVMQEIRFSNKLYQVANEMKNREFLLIPGVPNYMKVRPGEMPTVNILGFSDWFVGQYMNFYYGDIDVKYNQIEDYMSPQYREQFKLFTKKSIKEVKDLSVTQVYQAPPAAESQRNTDKNGTTYYTVTYIGNTIRYTNEQVLPPSDPQVVILKFRTSRIDSTKMWLFEVANMSVMKKSEYDSINKISDAEKISLSDRG